CGQGTNVPPSSF
nr:immunoglobulin light chain junction region [Macaca mulatta]MOW33972.1 immunoglobulin light chain junction region [Macaca mulatta]MOW34015.1 immunoglobulin light chain junction region [Macaca mulatta]MOW34035.1 immunoglobulin light chain junction region [Macaca mulatta]MOW34731.1 immunoglobulin light chain junction region [Macaca mulatta]